MSAADTATGATSMSALPLTSCYEFVAYPDRLVEAGAIRGWPTRPGSVLRDEKGRPVLLHFAPERWLIPAPTLTLLQELTAPERRSWGALIDVEGKWQEVRIAADCAQRILARSIDVETVLAARECAAIMLFDCPAILARHDATINLWIAASFVQSFLAVSASLPITVSVRALGEGVSRTEKSG